LSDHVNQMGPLIDQELEKIDRRHAQLTRLGGELVEALNMYHNLMREPVGMGQPTMPYGMKMGMNAPLPSASMPQFSQHMGGGVQYSGYPSYDPNLAYPMMRPPHSAPAANGAGYSPIPYQTPQNNMGQQQPNMGSQMNNSMGIPNGQMGSQMPQPNVNQAMNPNMMQPGQIPYTQAIMNPHGQSMQSQGYDSNPQGQHPMGIPPNMGNMSQR
jgi:signal transducing adaptor molecule